MAISLIAAIVYLFPPVTRRPDPLASPPSAPLSPEAESTLSIDGPSTRLEAQEPTTVGVVLIQPKPNARYKVGEPIPVEGYLEVPAGASLFEREVYLANRIVPPRGRPALTFSRLVPWEEIDGQFRFKGSIDPPTRPGTYEARVGPPSISEDDESSGGDLTESARITRRKSTKRGSKHPVVRYRVIEEKS